MTKITIDKNMKSKTKLMLGDNITSLRKLPDNSVDSIVSDPPYGLSFMGKKWDYDVPSVEFWKEVLRVLKPGGHVLSFGGTRTYHRMVVNIEDAGFEIRDQIMWLYGSGFPKSHNIGKAVDKLQGNDREVVGREELKERSTKKVEDASNVFMPREYNYTKGNSPYEGWGTALKPTNEPICVARKPLSEKSVAENVLKWGTGGINIDGCRVGIVGKDDRSAGKRTCNIFDEVKVSGGIDSPEYIPNEEGRFPANIILDEIAGEFLDEQSGLLKSGDGKSGKHKINRNGNTDGVCKMDMGKSSEAIHYGDKGGASRFFYQAKVSKQERNMGLDCVEGKDKVKFVKGGLKCDNCNKWKNSGSPCVCDTPNFIEQPFNGTPNKNVHPTVKPVALMSYLVRLVTPAGGIVLDPFMGSGSTGIAAQLEGFRFCGMEMDEDYFKIAEARIENYEQYRKFVTPNQNLKNGNTRMASRNSNSTSIGLGICKKKED
jgi:DNA modification methylase